MWLICGAAHRPNATNMRARLAARWGACHVRPAPYGIPPLLASACMSIFTWHARAANVWTRAQHTDAAIPLQPLLTPVSIDTHASPALNFPNYGVDMSVASTDNTVGSAGAGAKSRGGAPRAMGLLQQQYQQQPLLSRATKVVFRLRDGNLAESVLLEYAGDSSGLPSKTASSAPIRTVCVSSQVGCRFDCTFCSNSRFGLVRHLSLAEILAQILWFDREARDVRAVSLHGIGEPLENPHIINTIGFLREYYHITYGFKFSSSSNEGAVDGREVSPSASRFGVAGATVETAQRPPLKVSVSTIGVLGELENLMHAQPGTDITFSLLSPVEEERRALAPQVSKEFPLDSILCALDSYAQTTRRRVVIGYLPLNGVNDSPQHALQLARLLQHPVAPRSPHTRMPMLRKELYTVVLHHYFPLGVASTSSGVAGGNAKSNVPVVTTETTGSTSSSSSSAIASSAVYAGTGAIPPPPAVVGSYAADTATADNGQETTSTCHCGSKGRTNSLPASSSISTISEYEPSSPERIQQFMDILRREGLDVRRQNFFEYPHVSDL